MLNDVYVKEGNTGAVMGARLLFVSFTIAPKFMIFTFYDVEVWPKQNARCTFEIPSPTLLRFCTPNLSVCTDGLSAVR